MLPQQTQPLSPAAASRHSSAAVTPKSPLGSAHFGAAAAQLASVGEVPEALPPDGDFAAAAAPFAGAPPADGGGEAFAANGAVDAAWDPESQPAAAGEWSASQPTTTTNGWQQQQGQQQQDWEAGAADPEGGAEAAGAQEAAQETYTQEQVRYIARPNAVRSAPDVT